MIPNTQSGHVTSGRDKVTVWQGVRWCNFRWFEKHLHGQQVCTWLNSVRKGQWCRGLNNRVNHTPERAQHIVFKEFSADFEGLLAKDESATIHNENLQQLAIEIFKLNFQLYKSWELVPQNFVEANSLSSFKNKIKKGIPKNWLCRLCKTSIAQVGFI